MSESGKIKKTNGIYYTPPELAEFLIKPLLTFKNDELSIFDPAYGDGALLLAAERLLQQKYKINSKKLYGCDIMPQNNKLLHLPRQNIYTADFLLFSQKYKFDIIIMNPPYVRHHTLSESKINKYQKMIRDTCKLNLSSDLWAYFIIKTLMHLREGGSIGAILPWSFLQAKYARIIRKHLAQYFQFIKLVILGKHYFKTALERVIIVWLKNYENTLKSIEFSFIKHINEKLQFKSISKKQWQDMSICIVSEKADVDKIISDYCTNYNFACFEGYADVRIGVVTGADTFFLMDSERAIHMGFKDTMLIPIFTSAKQFTGLTSNNNSNLKRLIIISPDKAQEYKKYLKKGKNNKFHLRAHSLRRNPWYYINPGKIPDAFFPYRVSKIPYMIINKNNLQCTNSIHRVYFKNINDTEKKWIQISLLSAPGQLSLERYAKTYGSGVMKIEPIALKKSIVYKNSSKDILNVYKQISRILSFDKKKAVKVATSFISDYLHIPKSICDKSLQILYELQERRSK